MKTNTGRGRPAPCQLCGSSEGVQSFIGGPVSLRCKKCTKVLAKWEEAKKVQRALWRTVNGVAEAKEDDWGIDARRVEIEVLGRELERVVDNCNKDKAWFGGSPPDTKKLAGVARSVIKTAERLKALTR